MDPGKERKQFYVQFYVARSSNESEYKGVANSAADMIPWWI